MCITEITDDQQGSRDDRVCITEIIENQQGDPDTVLSVNYRYVILPHTTQRLEGQAGGGPAGATDTRLEGHVKSLWGNPGCEGSGGNSKVTEGELYQGSCWSCWGAVEMSAPGQVVLRQRERKTELADYICCWKHQGIRLTGG